MWSIKTGEQRNKTSRQEASAFAMPESGKDERHLYHEFTEKEWNEYKFGPKESLEKFLDLKTGLFLHIGLSAMGKAELGWSRYTHKIPDTKHGHIPDEQYDGWAKHLRFESMNAKDWARTARCAGMKYVVIIAKHHDGFNMWDTKFSEHKITNAPYGKDYLKEMVEAFREEGLKIGIYFSQRDWYHPDYEPVTQERFDACGGKPPYRMGGKPLEMTERHKKYIRYLQDAVRELVTEYGKIDYFWWDSLWWGGMFEKEMWDAEETERIIRANQPDILINNRNSLVGDYDTPELRLGYFRTDRAWETCMPLSTGWSYRGTPPKSLKELVRLLVGCVCGGGNLLLSMGCMPDGAMAKEEKARLEELGAFLQKYSDSIYATRACYLEGDRVNGLVRGKDAYYAHCTEGNALQFPLGGVKEVECLTGNKFEWSASPKECMIRFEPNQVPDAIFRIHT